MTNSIPEARINAVFSITAKYWGICEACGKFIHFGEQCLYDPDYKVAYCLSHKQITTMPSRVKVDTKAAEAILEPIWDKINEEYFFGLGNFYLSGSCVRDAVLGGIIEKYTVTTNWLDSGFAEKCFKLLNAPIDQQKVNGIPVEFVKMGNWDPAWNCDNGHYTKGILNTFSFVGILKIRDVPTKNPEDVLKQGVAIATRYGLQIDEQSLRTLALEIDKRKPLEIKDKVIQGFRSYKIQSNGYLGGMFNGVWKTEKLSVDCANFRQHIKEIPDDHMHDGQSNNGHGCGIYIHSNPSEVLYEYKSDAVALVVGWGDIAEFERGYRVEHCRIDKLWVWGDGHIHSKDNHLKLRGNYNCEIIVNAAYEDFLREVLK